jgi:hypothetical protein
LGGDAASKQYFYTLVKADSPPTIQTCSGIGDIIDREIHTGMEDASRWRRKAVAHSLHSKLCSSSFTAQCTTLKLQCSSPLGFQGKVV